VKLVALFFSSENNVGKCIRVQKKLYFNCLGVRFNPLNAELNPICYLLALLELTIFSTLAG